MARTQFLQPRSVDLPSQGDFTFTPIFAVREADSAAELETLLNVYATVEGQNATRWVVVEEIEYQVYQTLPPMAGVKYSAMIWLTIVEII